MDVHRPRRDELPDRRIGQGEVPTEQCSVNFAKDEVEYAEQNEDGSLGG